MKFKEMDTLHLLLILQKYNPEILGEIIDLFSLSCETRSKVLTAVLVNKPAVYFTLVDFFDATTNH